MRLVLAVSPTRKHFAILRKCNVEHILISYHFVKKVDELFRKLDGYLPKSIILDSGAFSVWANNQHIDINSYISFAKQLRERLPSEVELNIVNLDVLPGKFGQRPTDKEREESAQKGWENMLQLEKEGLKVIHVYHQHEKVEWLDKLREHSDYIGISPANDVSMREKLQFMDSCYTRIKASVKTHGFAVTSPDQLYRYPLYSADSSSWVAAARYGTIPLFYDDLSIKWLHYKNKDEVLKHWDYVRSLGMEKLGAEAWEDRTELAIRSYQKLQEVSTKLWSKRGITWN
jgi:hypothetical protein